MKKRSLLIILTALFMLLLLGCNETSDKHSVTTPDLSPPLQKMQGTWQTVDTNLQCTAIFQMHTLRIRYQDKETEEVFKRNTSIDRVDAMRNQLIVHGGTGAWPYRFIEKDGQEQLTLEFYTQKGWRHIQLKRKET